jgi:peptide/nickel transport system substrate-binding protein
MELRQRVIGCVILIVMTVLLISSASWDVRGQSRSTVVVGLGGETDSLDMVTSAGGGGITRQTVFMVFDTLVRVDPLTGRLEPRLATSWRAVNPTTYLFVLRRGVRFHNGEEFNAESVKFTIDLIIDPKISSFLKSRLVFVERVEIVDSHTVRIITRQPDVLLPTSVADVPIYPHRYYQQVGTRGFSTNPVGTGAFRFVRWDKGVRIVFERFGAYWGKQSQIDELVVRPFVESATRLGALQAGEIDVAVNVPPDDAERLRQRGYQIAWAPVGLAMVLGFNAKEDSPLRDRRVREAINYAIDKETLVKKIMLGFGRVLNGQLVGPDAFGYDPNLRAYPYDPQRARQLLAQAGFANGFSIVMENSEGRYTKSREIGEAIVGQLAQVGIKVEMRMLEFATFTRKLLFDHTAAPMYYVGWVYFPSMDADAVLRHYATGSPFKIWSNPRYDDLFGRQRAELDRSKRLDLIRQASGVLRQDAPGVFLFQGPGIYALSRKVKGFKATADEAIDYSRISVAP